MASIGGSEMNAASLEKKTGVRRDPFAMLPFCGYNMGDYFAHWISTGKRKGAQLPKIFNVNWFRRDENGKFLWPGYGENSRVLAFIFNRCNGEGETVDTPIGKVPAPNTISLEGLAGVDEAKMAKVLEVNNDEWKAEIALIEEHYARFGAHLPTELTAELNTLKERLGL
jgi:phosphoenolpyruvate carboxykinase (GTP)